MTTEEVISKIYKILENVTPLKTDCGKLCDCECCKGDNSIGMLLFPGEEFFYKGNSDFNIIDIDDNKKILVCSGRCDRTLRPVSCRLFPLIPIVFEGKLYIIDDPRASGVCPLIYDNAKLNKKFEKAVYKAGKLLLKNEITSEFLHTLTDEISEILSLRENFFK